jgi:hypothetical protein
MSIRFACPNCSQKLSISSRKAGTKSRCPRCQKEITVPSPVSAAEVAAQGPAQREPTSLNDLIGPAPPADRGAPFEQFVFDDETELVYDTDEPIAEIDPALDTRLISIPRWALYGQGVLLAMVGLACFVLGLVAGGSLLHRPAPTGPLTCTVTGSVAYQDAGESLPDAGAVVIALPESEKLDTRAPTVGLRPEDPHPPADQPGLEIIRTIGGGYARTHAAGPNTLELPDRGKYYFLVLSHDARPRRGTTPATEDILRLGRYLQDADEFLRGRRYQLTAEQIRGDQRFSVAFD